MSIRTSGRLETLSSVRRVEKTRKLDALSAAQQEVDRTAEAILAVRRRVETLRASLDAPFARGAAGAGILTAVMAYRSKVSAALDAAQTEMAALCRRQTDAEAALDAARDEAARAHRALAAVEKRLDQQS